MRAIRVTTTLVLALAMLGWGCAPDAAPSLTAAHAPEGLREAAQLAEVRLGVPADLVLALGWVETRWQGALEVESHADDDHSHGPGLIGLAGIRPSLEGDLLAVAARALETDAEAIDADSEVGVLATAYVLRELALRRHGALPAVDDVGAWREVLGDYTGLEDEASRARYVADVLHVLALGLEAEASNGEVVLIPSREITEVEATGVGVASAYLSEYEGAHWLEAGPGHWRAGRDGHSITHIIIHTMQGSYSGSIGWFRDPANPYDTSTHYLIRSSDGDITQMVEEADTAHHIGGWNPWTIGIEHEGYIENPSRWYTDVMYRSSARLVRHLCDKYSIPIDREHILGHVEVPGASHTDPGPGWNWDYYMGLVRAAAPSGPAYDATLVAIAEQPTELVSGGDGVVRIDYRNDGSAGWSVASTRLGTSAPRDRESPFYADYNWIDARRPTAADAATGSGATGRFSFVVVAPEVTEVTEMIEHYQVFDETGGFFGDEVEVRIRVRPRDTAVSDAGTETPVDAAVEMPLGDAGPGIPGVDGGTVGPARDAGTDGDTRPHMAGGCGCAASGSRGGSAGFALVALALASVMRRRRA